MPKSTASPTYYPALDGLRGLGIVTTMLYHLGVGMASGGFLAISMFFTLSGYLIGGQLISQHRRTGAIDFAGFWERRFRRLLPASSVGLLGALAYTAWLARPDEGARFAGDILSALLYVPNWRFVFTGQSYEAAFTDPTPVQHFWSLGVEEQFYVFLPFLVAWTLSRGSLRSLAVVIALLSLASSVAMGLARTPGTPLGHAYYGTDARAAEFLVGVLLAVWLTHRGQPQRVASWLGVVLLAGMLGLWYTTSEKQLWFYRGGAPAYALATAVLIQAAIQPGLVTRLLSSRPVVYLGKISYGIYVYHWPVFLAVDAVGPGVSGPLGIAAKMGIPTVLAAVSYRYFEAPIRRRSALVGTGGRAAAVVGTGAVAALSLALIFREPPVDPRIADALRMPPTLAAKADSGRVRIAVVGNSVAKNLAFGLELWARESRVTVHDWAHYGCGMMRGGSVRHFGRIDEDDPEGTCRAVEARVDAALANAAPDVILLVTGPMDLRPRQMPGWPAPLLPGDPEYDAELIQQYVEVVDRLSASGAHVVWLTFPCHDIEETVGVLEGTDALDIARIHRLNDYVLPQVAALRPDAVEVLDLFDRLCPDGHFSADFQDVERARPDGLHLRPVASRRLADWLGPELVARAARRGPSHERSDRREPGRP